MTNRAGYKVTTTTSEGMETRYATPRVIQTLMHWYYRCEVPADRTLLLETAMLYGAGMLEPIGKLEQAETVRASCDWGLPPARELAWLFDAVRSVGWEPTKAGKAWVRALLAMPPPVPPRSRRDRTRSGLTVK